MRIIPLGEGCNISWALQEIELKPANSIFEWFLSVKFTDVNTIIHKIISNEPIEITNRSELPGNIFLHDTAIRSNHYNLKNFPDRLERRTKRFKDQVSSNENILFIREEHNAYSTTIEDINQFKKLIKTFNPNCNYKILLLMPLNVIKEPLKTDNLYHKINLKNQNNLLQYIKEIEQDFQSTQSTSFCDLMV